MLNKNIGFIGCGNMGTAMIGGIASSGLCAGNQIMASAPSMNHLQPLADTYGIQIGSDNLKTAQFADILFLAIKPYMFPAVIAEIKSVIKKDAVIISIAAGQTLANIQQMFGTDIKLVRVMPNTPAMVGEAMSAITPNTSVSETELLEITSIFDSFGKSEVVTESLMDAVTGVSGSSPAYVYMFIEAMADAAVMDGMPRAQAYKFAAQSVLGAAKMVLETGTHPGALKDAVCSPGGTTIAAVAKLEEKGLRNAVISAQTTCSAISRAMSQGKK